MSMSESHIYVILERRELLFRALRVRKERDGSVYVADFAFVTCAGKSAQETQSAVRSLFDKIRYRGEEVYVLLPHEQVSTRYLQFPAVDRSELESLIRHRLPVLFPLGEDEVAWGYEPVFTDRKGSSCVFVNVVQRIHVDAAVEVVRANGGRLAGVYFLFAAYPRVVGWVAGEAPSEYAAVLVSGRSAEVAVIRSGKTAVIRRVAFDKNDPQGLGRELMKTVGRYTAFDDHGPVGKVYVLGDKDEIATIAEALRASTVYAIEALDVGAYVGRYATQNQRFSGNMAPMLAFAESLPVETLSFLPREYKEKNDLRRALRRYAVAGVLALCAAGTYLAGAFLDVAMARSRADALDRLYAKDHERYAKLTSMQTYLDERVQGAAGIASLLDAYYAVHTVAEPGIVLSRFSFDSSQGDRFIAVGSAETGAQIFAYVERLKKSGIFSSDGVKLNYYRDATVGEKKRVAFEVVLR
jgi:hypothetical protein